MIRVSFLFFISTCFLCCVYLSVAAAYIPVVMSISICCHPSTPYVEPYVVVAAAGECLSQGRVMLSI